MKGGITIVKTIRNWALKRTAIKNKEGSGVSQSLSQKLKDSRLYLYVVLAIVACLMVIINGQVELLKPVVPEVGNVHYIDAVGQNLLFRGGLPQYGTPAVFNYDGLKLALTNAGKRAGIKVPDAFYLFDINLLNIENPSDAQRILTEQDFFRAKPGLGRIQVWGINGIGLHVNDPALAGKREYLARNLESWLNDRLASRVETLRGWLESSPSTFTGNRNLPVVFYIHCVAGCDRTGELSGAYYLRYMGKSWEEVNVLNRSMCRHNRPFGCKNYRALQWYCLWLNLKRGFSLHWWKDFSCSGH